MKTFIKNTAFTQTSKNGKLLNRQGYDLTYDENGAVIDSLNNNNLFRIQLDTEDIMDFLKQYHKLKRIPSRSSNTFNINDGDIVSSINKSLKSSAKKRQTKKGRRGRRRKSRAGRSSRRRRKSYRRKSYRRKSYRRKSHRRKSRVGRSSR